MLKKSAIFIIVLMVVLFLSSLKKTSLAVDEPVTLGPWQETTPFISDSLNKCEPIGGLTTFRASHPLPAFAFGNYFYIQTKCIQDPAIPWPTQDPRNANQRNIYKAQQQTEGKLGPWSKDLDTGLSVYGFTAVNTEQGPFNFILGTLGNYKIGSNGNITELVDYGSGPTSTFDGIRYIWDNATYISFDTNKYIFHLGGFKYGDPSYPNSYDNSIFRKKLPISQNTTFERLSTTSPDFTYKAAFYRPSGANYGFIYIGFKDNRSKISRIRVNEDGSLVGNWQNSANLSLNSEEIYGDMFVIGDQLFVIRGKKVFQATINPNDGSLSSWRSANPLPEDQVKDPVWTDGHPEGASYGIIGCYVYVTGKDKVFYAKINGLPNCGSGNQPTNTGIPPSATNPPAATATPSPTPTFPPCPTSPADPKMKIVFQVDRVANPLNFNNSGGLQVIGVNFDNRCQVVKNNINITYDSGFDFFSAPFQLPAGNNKGYDLLLMGPRNLRQKFSGIKLSATENEIDLDCTVDNPPAGCGELITKRAERKLWSGDANEDGVINLLDFELYRQNVGKNATGNNVDFDFNGKVEYKNGVDDDFIILKNNFGKSGIVL